MSNRWSVAEQIEMCAHIVPLIRSGLPIDRGLKAIAADLPARIAQVSGNVQRGLENGERLSTVLAGSARPASRSLSATIEAGEQSGQLGTLIQSWAAMHTAQAQSRRRIRWSLVYPILLIVIAIVAIGHSIATLVPQYRLNLASIHSAPPAWFGYIELLHRNLVGWGIVCSILCLMPIIIVTWRRNTFDSGGWPRDLAFRSRLQSHAALIAIHLLSANATTDKARSLMRWSLGLKEGACNQLDGVTKSILDLLDKGSLSLDRAKTMLCDVSQTHTDRAVVLAESQGKWLVYAVSLSVAVVVGLSYLVIIFLPWLYLMDQMKELHPIR
jgi:hypothetical protein